MRAGLLTTLERLRAAEHLHDVAKILGFAPKGLSYVVYRLNQEDKYREFEIPKKTGGTRTIHAPTPKLSLLQNRLAQRLDECVEEIQQTYPRFWRASFAFQNDKTIVANADAHRRRRYVFNVDLEDFFGSINFGRVRGFFIKDSAFQLSAPVATLIAQIACHHNALPQGSPCSPIISNLVGNILDSRLLALARDCRCTYTRYADDLTFSTNTAEFPVDVAKEISNGKWQVGERLRYEIGRTGFSINPDKTRMFLRESRQTVTGLIVNSKPNIKQEYYRSVRAMCNSLFQQGEYYRTLHDGTIETTTNLNPLEGMLSYIHFVKARRDRPEKVNKVAEKAGDFCPPKGPSRLYEKFLFYKNFVAPTGPIIVTEGISDVIYIKCAIRALVQKFPLLGVERAGSFERFVGFLKPSGASREILELAHGTSGQAALVAKYSKSVRRYGHRPLPYPVIILCDNDNGANSVFKNAGGKCKQSVSTGSTEPFYYLGDNLYLVKVPEGDPAEERDIESLFPSWLLNQTIDGKPFDKSKEHMDKTAFGKVIFAEKIVHPHADAESCGGFAPLLARFEECIRHYASLEMGTLKLSKGAAST